MSWTIIKARERTGLPAGEKDLQLKEAMDVALAAAETYCDRKFLLEDDEQEFTAPINYQLLVRRYPLQGLIGIGPLEGSVAVNPPLAPEPAPAQWRMDKKRGIVFIVGQPPWVRPVGATAPPNAYAAGPHVGFTLYYTGGYDPLPADLEAALWMTFDSVWATTPGYGLAAGAAPSDTPVKSFAIDGMAISYDTASGSGSSSSGGLDPYGILPGRAMGILDSYRAETAALGG